MREIMGESLARARWVIWLALRLPLYTHVLGWRRRRRIRPPLTSHLFFPPSAEVGIVSLVGGHGMCWQTTSTSAKSCSSNTAETSNTSLLLLLLLLLSIQDTPSHLLRTIPTFTRPPNSLISLLLTQGRSKGGKCGGKCGGLTNNQRRKCHDTTILRLSGRLIQNES